ncbi:MAG: hypothetical protein ABGW97_06685, partial [Christiangramia sp.]|uniref:hypothetical protein n=1 Tax=Christiangramia sp. TaxID=1931228 RepID=UPI003242AE9E
KKRPFFLGILPYQANRKKAPKFLPRLQKFLTEPSRYTEEKEVVTLRVWVIFLCSIILSLPLKGDLEGC